MNLEITSRFSDKGRTRIHAGFVSGERPDPVETALRVPTPDPKPARPRRNKWVYGVLAVLVMFGLGVLGHRLNSRIRTCVETHCVRPSDSLSTVSVCISACRAAVFASGICDTCTKE
jgi:hypothetical protein